MSSSTEAVIISLAIEVLVRNIGSHGVKRCPDRVSFVAQKYVVSCETLISPPKQDLIGAGAFPSLSPKCDCLSGPVLAPVGLIAELDYY